jgi:flagellar biogenesis protein FliO
MRPEWLLVPFLAIAAPSRAAAGPLEVSITEDPSGATVTVRDGSGALAEPKIAQSRRGLLLVFDGSVVPPGRVYSSSRRLRFVQTGQNGGRAVVRLVQRDAARGSFPEFMRTSRTEEAVEIRVLDAAPSPASLPAAQEPVVSPPGQAQPTVQSDPGKIAALAALAGNDAPSVTPSSPAASAAAASAPAAAPPAAPPVVEEAPSPPAGPALATEVAQPHVDPVAAAQPAPSPVSASLAAGRSDAPLTRFGLMTAVPSLAALGALGLWLQRRKRRSSGERRLEVAERVALGPKHQVVFVRVAGRELLLGATDQNLALLADLGPASPAAGTGSEPDAGGDDAGPPAHKVEAFKARLQAALVREATSSGREPAATPANGDPVWASAPRPLMHNEVA